MNLKQKQQTDRLEEAATCLILEWVGKLFTEKIANVKDLALYLINKMHVDTDSQAAKSFLSQTQPKNKRFGRSSALGKQRLHFFI